MKKVFKQRQLAFRQQCLSYLRYVLNDHFVLFLMIGLGFIMIQYSQLLDSLPSETWLLHLILVLCGLGLSFWGNHNAYLERPDQHFLLAKEEEIVVWFKGTNIRSFLLWGSLQTLLLLFLLPLALALGWPIWVFAIYLLASLAFKWLIFSYRIKELLTDRGLAWPKAIGHDLDQKQKVLKFFSLFTQVKGVRQEVKRRSYLDVLLSPFSKKTWTYLFARAFVRSGDYLALSLRLIALTILVLFFIPQDFVATALVLLFNYLLLFQLLALYASFDYQYLVQLFPLPHSEKSQGLIVFLRSLMTGLMLIQGSLAVFLFKDKIYLLLLLGGQLIINHLYLTYKIKKLFD